MSRQKSRRNVSQNGGGYGYFHTGQKEEENSMARTGNNIYKRKDGRYEGRILVGRNSRRKPKYIYIYAKTLREVKRKMSEARIDRLDAEQGEPDISVQTAAEEWVRTTKKKWKPTTLRMYQSIVSRYAIPILGGLSVLKITDETLAEFAESLDEYSDKKCLSDRYKKYICCLVRQIIRNAHNIRHLEQKILLIPEFQIQKKIIQLPPEQDLIRLKQYLLKNPEDDTCLGILVAMSTGIRIGELCALQWGDFDLERGNVIIRKNLQRIRNAELQNRAQKDEVSKTQVCIQMPKTASSIRIIPLADGLTDLLRAHRKSPEKYLIPGRKREWVDIRTLQYRFSSILKKCRIQPFHFHLLRHAFASRCVELGCDIKGLSEILGHSSVQITMNIYVHSSTKQKKDMMNLVCCM